MTTSPEYYRIWRVVLPLVFTGGSVVLGYIWVENRVAFWLVVALMLTLYIRWVLYWWHYDDKNPTLKK